MSCRGRTGPSAPRVAQRHYLPDPVSALSPTPTLPACFVAPIRDRKTQESEPRALPGSLPRIRGRESQEGHKKKETVPGQQKANAWPLPSSVLHCVPVFRSLFQIILVRPALSASLGCHYASRRNPLVFLKSRRKAPESPLWCGRETQGESISHLPNQLLESSLAARSPENNIRASTMHIQSGIHLLTPRRPALQHHALTIKGYSRSGALPRTTLMHTRSYFNALQIMWLIILYDCVSHHRDCL